MAELLYINSSGTNVYGSYYTGQSFTTTGAWLVQSIWIDSVRTLTAGPFDVTCSIYLDAGGVPTGAALGVSDPVSCNNVLATKTFTFSTPVSLSNATKYWAIIDCAGADATWFVRTDSSAYANGEVGYGSSGDLSDFTGDSSYDCKQFKVNGLEAPSSYASVKDGEWDDGDTWGYPASAGGFYPSVDGDDVTITHTVTYSISADVELGQIDINSGGTLSFNPSANTYMEIQNNTFIYVNDGGWLEIGTSGMPIHKNYTAELVFNCSTDAQAGIDSNNSGSVSLYGDTNYFGQDKETFLAYDCTGSTSITATDDMSSKWNIGDEIALPQHQLYTNWTLQGTVTTIIGFDGNIIHCADAISTSYEQDGVIANLTRNVQIYKKGYSRGWYQTNTGRPYIIFSNFQSTKLFSSVSIAGFYDTRSLHMNYSTAPDGIVEWCVWRNGTRGVYSSYNTKIYDCIFFSNNEANQNLYQGEAKNIIGICNSRLFYGCQDTYFENIFSYNSSQGVGGLYGVKFKNLQTYSCGYDHSSVQLSEFYDSYFCYSFYGCHYSNSTNYYNCSFGIDPNSVTKASNAHFYSASHNCKLINCKFDREMDLYNENNVSVPRSEIKIENFNQVQGDDRFYSNYGECFKVNADGSGNNPSQRSGGNDTVQEISTYSWCGYSSSLTEKTPNFTSLEQQIYTQAGVEKTIRYYIQTDYTSGLTSDDFWLEAYYDISSIKSTNTITTRSNQSDWSQYVEVTVTPSQDSWIRLKINIAAYESGKYIWVDPKPEIIF